MQELDLNGVFVSAVLAWALIAFIITSLIGRVLGMVGFYRLVWHRALFDFAVFVIVWGAVSAMAYRLAFPHAGLD
jgi:hypothetical protein